MRICEVERYGFEETAFERRIRTPRHDSYLLAQVTPTLLNTEWNRLTSREAVDTYAWHRLATDWALNLIEQKKRLRPV